MPAPRYAGPRASTPPVYRGRPQTATANRPAAAYGHASAHAVPGRAGTASARGAGFRRPGNNGGWHTYNGIRFYTYGPIAPVGWWWGPYQFYPWLDADLSYDYWHDTGDTDTAIAMASAGADMMADSGSGAQPPWPNGGDPYAQDQPDADAPASWTATQLDTGAPALTLVYKTGKTEQVANYVVSRSAVTVIDDSGVRSVPVTELDLTAMAKANSQAGLQLPDGLRSQN
jgi:hypothetical protein